MSKIHRVKTELRNPESLRQAVSTVCARHNIRASFAADLGQNTLPLVDYYHNTTRVSVMIDRNSLQSATGRHLYGGLGWAWNGSSFDAAIDHIDTNKTEFNSFLDEINQEYALAEIQRYVANNPSYTFQQETLEDGTMRVVLTGWS